MASQTSTLERIEIPVKAIDPMYHMFCGICYPDHVEPPEYAQCGHKFIGGKIEFDEQANTCTMCWEISETHYKKQHSAEGKRFPGQ